MDSKSGFQRIFAAGAATTGAATAEFSLGSAFRVSRLVVAELGSAVVVVTFDRVVKASDSEFLLVLKSVSCEALKSSRMWF